jgi:hypothetical protein
MTEPVPEPPFDQAAEVDRLLAAAHAWIGLDELDRARDVMRRGLMDAWYDGQSAGLNAARRDFLGRPNPWLKSDK